MKKNCLKRLIALILGAAMITAATAGCSGAYAPALQESPAGALQESPAGAPQESTDEAGLQLADGETEPMEALPEPASYVSEDGWTMRYDPELVTVNEGDGFTDFVYTGESAGTNMVTVSCLEGKQPEEALYELTESWSDEEDIQRSEGFFPGTTDKWSFWRILRTGEEGSGLTRAAIAAEYNGGVLMYDITAHISGDDAIDMRVSDTLSEMINSVTFKNFGPQTMYDYVPGVYTYIDERGEDETPVVRFLTLNGDHTGTLSLEEDIPVLWGSTELIAQDGSSRLEYTVEGENLYLDRDGEWTEYTKQEDMKLSGDASDFVLLSEAVPDAILEIRYYSTYNFVGRRISGYEEPLAFLTKEAADALKEVSDDLIEKGYRLKIYDAYRPQKAVTDFMNWALDPDDTKMKDYFYPELEKDVLFPQGYIAEHSGHSRGSTVDLTLFDMKTEKEVDMGGTFDYFGELSHPDYTEITEEQYENRMILREAMTSHGFKPLAEEWWHFTLEDEPYPDTYFTFPINSDCLAVPDR